jgi:hypothetical protein
MVRLLQPRVVKSQHRTRSPQFTSGKAFGRRFTHYAFGRSRRVHRHGARPRHVWGIEIESGRTPNAVVGYVQTKYTHTFATPFAAVPVVTVVSQAGMKDREGSWAVLTGAKTTATLGVAVDEDQTADAERNHLTEEVDYIVFSASGAIQLTPVV